MMRFHRPFAGMLLLASAGSLTAGTLLTVNVESGRGGSILTHEIRVQGRRVRMDTVSEGVNQAVLYNHETRNLFVVNEDKKIFRRVRHEDAERRRKEQAERREAFLAGIEHRIRAMPPDQQTAMRKMLNHQADPAADESRLECRRGDESKPVGNWSADYYDCFVGSRRVREVWSVPWEKTGLVPEEIEALKEFIRRRGDASHGPAQEASGGFLIAADAFPGLAVQSLEVRDRGPQRGHEVSGIESKSMDSTLFFVDGSYTEAAADQFMVPIR